MKGVYPYRPNPLFKFPSIIKHILIFYYQTNLCKLNSPKFCPIHLRESSGTGANRPGDTRGSMMGDMNCVMVRPTGFPSSLSEEYDI